MKFQIFFWNRYTKQKEAEAVYGDFWIRALYQSKLGFWLTNILLATPFISKIYGFFQTLPISKKKIAPFITKFNINMDDFEQNDFANFNDFFIRAFRTGKRKFVTDALPAPAEARYLGYENASASTSIPIKGLRLKPEDLLGKDNYAKFANGPALVARLCPVDYHRFHYPADGTTLDTYSLGNKLHSVNPLALKASPSIFTVNERVVSILDTKKYGLLAYVEVGALCVGKIVQTHPISNPFQLGDQKGYFLFGASTVILFGEPGAWSIAPDILQNTNNGLETFVRLGDTVANSL